ncbi:MAG: helix-turn-helix domain-containing protein [Clostridia bacterium]|nr:helix-turn-helix domain-containing protein [Clostridia bacterium]
MRSNQEAFEWLLPVTDNAERRDYPMRGDSMILAMTDMISYPPYAHDESHSHNCMEIGLCVAGNGMILREGLESQPFQAGTVIIIPEGALHSQKSEGLPMTRWRYIAVDQERLIRDAMPNCRDSLMQLLRGNRQGVCLDNESARSDIAWLIERMFDIKCRTAEEYTAELEAILLLILMRVLRRIETDGLSSERENAPYNPVQPALLYISEQYHTEIKIAQLARSCAMSESHFRKVFVAAMGETPVEYLNRYRIDRAVRMIRTNAGDSISRIAETCGFASIATFNRNFLKYTGKNPSEMKKYGEHLRSNGGDKIVQNG